MSGKPSRAIHRAQRRQYSSRDGPCQEVLRAQVRANVAGEEGRRGRRNGPAHADSGDPDRGRPRGAGRVGGSAGAIASGAPGAARCGGARRSGRRSRARHGPVGTATRCARPVDGHRPCLHQCDGPTRLRQRIRVRHQRSRGAGPRAGGRTCGPRCRPQAISRAAAVSGDDHASAVSGRNATPGRRPIPREQWAGCTAGPRLWRVPSAGPNQPAHTWWRGATVCRMGCRSRAWCPNRTVRAAQRRAFRRR